MLVRLAAAFISMSLLLIAVSARETAAGSADDGLPGATAVGPTPRRMT
jgi:hypothetical protein